MIESRRLAYLDALGFDVWKMKPAGPEPGRLLFSPGEGSTLLIGDSAESTVTRLAGDIGRALGGKAVWAWPDPESRDASPTLAQAVEQFLFTRVVLFGPATARSLLGGAPPEILGSAKILVSPDIAELEALGEARRALWKLISA